MVTHEGSMDVWDALAEQRRHQSPPRMTVADIQRQRDGADFWDHVGGGFDCNIAGDVDQPTAATCDICDGRA